VGLLDALDIERVVLAGYDWGGRAACIVAAMLPERVTGLVSVNGYQIQDIAASSRPIRPDLEAGFWYFYYFLTDRGRAGLTANRREIAEVIWRRNSPAWDFDQATLDRTATAFANPDYVDVVLHSYRHRLGQAPGAPQYEGIERTYVKRDWAEKLGVFQRGDQAPAIDWALNNALDPHRPPNALSFRQMCQGYKPPQRPALPTVKKPVPDRFKAVIAHLSEPLQDTRPEAVRVAARFIRIWGHEKKLNPRRQERMDECRLTVQRYEERLAAEREAADQKQEGASA
jgi:pimeloyl-ACP methyl ester carboxylesterase